MHATFAIVGWCYFALDVVWCCRCCYGVLCSLAAALRVTLLYVVCCSDDAAGPHAGNDALHEYRPAANLHA